MSKINRGPYTIQIFLIVIWLTVAFASGCSVSKTVDPSNSRDAGPSTADTNKSSEPVAAPSDEIVQGLVRRSVADLAAAVQSGDFAAMYDSASSDFRSSYSLNEVGEIFKPFVTDKAAYVPIFEKAASMNAEFDSPPSIRREKAFIILVANGKFDTKPVNIRFEAEYVSRNETWQMLKLVIRAER